MKGNYSPLPQWAWAQGTPEVSGSLRVQLEDFRVQELPAVTPDGKGTHLWLEIEKCNANTDWVAHQLSISAGVPARDVGYAGMKDRRGVTSQWFSVALQEATNSAWENWSWPDIRILQACLHTRKLKRGTLHGNRFRLFRPTAIRAWRQECCSGDSLVAERRPAAPEQKKYLPFSCSQFPV
jgi:tRNA pseudouridine13 synthase